MLKPELHFFFSPPTGEIDEAEYVTSQSIICSRGRRVCRRKVQAVVCCPCAER